MAVQAPRLCSCLAARGLAGAVRVWQVCPAQGCLVPIQVDAESSRKDAERHEGVLLLALSAMEAALRRAPEMLGSATPHAAEKAAFQARSRLGSMRSSSDGCAGAAPSQPPGSGWLVRGAVEVGQVCPAQAFGP